MARNSCNKFKRFVASCETRIEARMLNNMPSGFPRKKTKVSLDGSVINSERTSSVVCKFHFRQHVCLVSTIVKAERARKLLTLCC
jgi:hypothetical protein